MKFHGSVSGLSALFNVFGLVFCRHFVRRGRSFVALGENAQRSVRDNPGAILSYRKWEDLVISYFGKVNWIMLLNPTRLLRPEQLHNLRIWLGFYLTLLQWNPDKFNTLGLTKSINSKQGFFIHYQGIEYEAKQPVVGETKAVCQCQIVGLIANRSFGVEMAKREHPFHSVPVLN